MAAADLLARNRKPNEDEVKDALGGVLCRCTGYQKIIEAVLTSANRPALAPSPAAGKALGARAGKVDGIAKLTGAEKFGADAIPADALWLRVIRSPHHRAAFAFGDLAAFAKHAGLVRVLTAQDVPSNGFGIYPHIKDQPVLAEGEARFRGEAVRGADRHARGDRSPGRGALPGDLGAAAAGDRAGRGDAGRRAAGAAGQARQPAARRRREARQRQRRRFPSALPSRKRRFETTFVEHAYIEPEAGWARVVNGRLEDPRHHADALHGPRRSRAGDEARPAAGAHRAHRLRRRLRRQARHVGAAARRARGLAHRPARGLRLPPAGKHGLDHQAPSGAHPRALRLRRRRQAAWPCDVDAVFDTGAYASWGPTVATRVPIHATGPYAVRNVRTRGRAFFTHCHPSGAFRGFGVPQGAIAHEALMDELADRLEHRPARIPPPECAQGRRHHRHRAAARAFRGSAASASTSSGRIGSDGTRKPMRSMQGRSGNSRRCAAASAWAACGTASAIPRWPIPRPCAS